MKILKETNFKNIGQKKVGKVRDIYVEKERIILISTDRHSSFDRIIAHIPCKGQVLTEISAFWFEKTKDIMPNHVLAVPDPNVILAKKCRPLPVEIVVRGYITGVTDTSLWTQYQKGQRNFGNFVLPDGMKKNEKLKEAVLTPTTKSDKHDRPITPKEIVAEGLLTKKIWKEVAEAALRLFDRGVKVASKSGLILVDTKYEFGIDGAGNVILIDEVHTPDSSRYWQKATYARRVAAGKDPEYFDKEFLRLWFKENCDPYNDKVLPPAPIGLVKELSRRYIQIYEQITRKKFVAPGKSEDIVKRIAKNLKKYHVAA
ncbi:MAG: phosphoribosylaminoimidazole-succinocarboxamide synthase [Candidatus Parcubacteria bacterium]|jgi:phosphoribosylaminoimidazole-succinocarboxamide synthase|nr:phosphoribosylaminoimidazole-succinocarboxamide synthase [Candidatus Parcubacteria bacterium]